MRLRQPNQEDCPAAVDPSRMRIYESLIYNNLDDLFSGAFPVLRSVLSDQQWRAMVEGFLAQYPAKTPLFHELPEMLINYITGKASAFLPDYAPELAHYEWVELALDISEVTLEDATAEKRALSHTMLLSLSPLAWRLTYRYPVHEIGPDNRPDAPGQDPTHLLVYRNRLHQVHFMQLNALTAGLLALIEERPHQAAASYAQMLAELLQAGEKGNGGGGKCAEKADSNGLHLQTRAVLEKLCQEDIIVIST